MGVCQLAYIHGVGERRENICRHLEVIKTDSHRATGCLGWGQGSSAFILVP
jgi:hypothetical protein